MGLNHVSYLTSLQKVLPTVRQHSITLLWAWEARDGRFLQIVILICDKYPVLIILPSLINPLSIYYSIILQLFSS